MTKELRESLDKQIVRILVEQSKQALSSGRTDAARSLAEKAYKIAYESLPYEDREFILAFSRLASVALELDENKAAVRLLASVLPAAETVLGSTDSEIIAILNNLSIAHLRNSRPDSALPLMQRTVEAKRALHGVGSFAYAENLQDLILIYEDLGLVAETEPYVREISAMFKIEFGDRSLEYARSLENLARACSHAGKESEFQELLEEAKLVKSKAVSVEELEKKAKQAYAEGDFSAARRFHCQIIDRLPALPFYQLGVEGNMFDPLLEYVNELEKKGRADEEVGKVEIAADAYNQIIEILRTSYGVESPKVAFACNNLALVRQKQGRFEEAKALYRTAMEVVDDAGIESDERSSITTNIAGLFLAMCDQEAPHPADAETHIEVLKESASGKPADYARSPRIRFPIPIPDETRAESVARWINARAKYYESIGDHERARFLYEREFELMQIVWRSEPGRLFGVVNELTHYYLRVADFAAANSQCERAMAIALEAFGAESIEIAQVYRNRGHLMLQLSNFAAAEETLSKAREIICNLLGNDHPNVALLDDDLVVVRLRMGRRQEAHDSLRSVVKRFEQRRDFDAVEAQRIATLLSEVGDYSKAEKLYERAQRDQQKTIGEWDPRYAMTMSNLGSLYRATGRFQEAAKCFQQASQIRQTEFGPDHTSVASSQIRLALSLAALGKFGEGLEAARDVLRIGDHLIADVSAISSQRQLYQLLDQQKNGLSVVLSLVLQFGGERRDLLRAAYEIVLRRKSLGAEALAARRLPILAGRYPHLQPKLEELNQLITLITQARLSMAKTSKDVLRRAEDSRERLEAELSREIQEMRFEQRLSTTTVDHLASCIPADTALIEYIRVTPYNFGAVRSRDDSETLPARYLAFVLHGGRAESLSFLDLGEAEEIDERIATLAETVGEAAALQDDRDLLPLGSSLTTESFRSSCLSIREKVLDPIVPFLDGKTRLLLVPDGQLFLLPFDILPVKSGGSLIDEFHISFLGAGRDVVRHAERQRVHYSAPAIVAGPEFNLRLPESSAPDAAAPGSLITARSLQELGAQFPPLPGAEAEGREVSALLKDPSLFCGADARESDLRKLKSPVLLHLATHGFFLSDMTSEAQPEDSMITSGLALAGANNWLAGEALAPEFEDGILTAEDVATLNLFETDLVVLSACRSGAGDVVAGEGVFGLRRALFAAGVRTIVMTLWKVPDNETKELMVRFYQAMQRGLTKSAALREAKLAIRELHPHPFYWGSFICEGDWMTPQTQAFAA